MKYFEVEYKGEHFRLQFFCPFCPAGHGEETYNVQTLIEGEWEDYHGFHFYEVDEETCDGKEGVK